MVRGHISFLFTGYLKQDHNRLSFCSLNYICVHSSNVVLVTRISFFNSLCRNKRKYVRSDEMTAFNEAMEGVRSDNELECKVACSSSKVHFHPPSFMVYVRQTLYHVSCLPVHLSGFHQQYSTAKISYM